MQSTHASCDGAGVLRAPAIGGAMHLSCNLTDTAAVHDQDVMCRSDQITVTAKYKAQHNN